MKGIYARVSDMKLTEEGKRRQDVERQVDLLSNYYIKRGVPKEQIIIYRDDGISGWTDDINSRPGFAKARNDMLRHTIDELAIESLDRFSSEIGAGLSWLDEYGKNNCQVTSLQDGELEVTTDTGWMKAAMFFMFAEWRIRSLRSKVRSGMARRANDARAICKSCGIVHMGRHPASCNCLKCLKKKGGVKNMVKDNEEVKKTGSG